MKISDWGEEQLIEYLAKQFPSAKNTFGIGDDCAVIPYCEETVQLVTTDALVEGIHFLKEKIAPRDIGYKAIAVNVSDIAAMGGRPKEAFLSIAMPCYTDSEWLKEFISGIKEGCIQYHVDLLGGDTVGSLRDLFINITVLGVAEQRHVKYRHAAQPGDVICLTRSLGESGAGFLAMQNNSSPDSTIESLIQAHCHPQIQVEEAVWLASHESVHAMMDISDGFAIDLGRILKASHCGAVVSIDQLPISEPLKRVCSENQWDPIKLALTGGEDYCFLFTASSAAYRELSRAFYDRFSCRLAVVGYITDQFLPIIYQDRGKFVDLDLSLYNHFKG